ncbi:hypothetical protein N7527_005475 [Penicillium freii]|nr:hypothetical protein N7527_005475 [Penicillium freii]
MYNILIELIQGGDRMQSVEIEMKKYDAIKRLDYSSPLLIYPIPYPDLYENSRRRLRRYNLLGRSTLTNSLRRSILTKQRNTGEQSRQYLLLKAPQMPLLTPAERAAVIAEVAVEEAEEAEAVIAIRLILRTKTLLSANLITMMSLQPLRRRGEDYVNSLPTARIFINTYVRYMVVRRRTRIIQCVASTDSDYTRQNATYISVAIHLLYRSRPATYRRTRKRSNKRSDSQKDKAI